MNVALWLRQILSSGWTHLRAFLKRRDVWEIIGLYLFFVGLACWSFFPIFEHIDSALIGNKNSDVLRNAWGFWWFKAMILERFRLPAFTFYLNFPMGMTLLAIDPLHCLFSIPLQLLFGLPMAYNLLLIAVVAFNGFGAACLVRALTGRLALGILAGAVFGYAPFVLSNALGGTSEVVNMGWVPLFMLSLIRAIQNPSRRAGLLTGLTLVCTASTSWYYGYISTLFGSGLAMALLAGRLWRREPLLPALKALAQGAVLFLLFFSWVAYTFRDLATSLQKGLLQGGKSQMNVLAGNAVNAWEIFAPAHDRWDRPSLYHLPQLVLIIALILMAIGLLRRPLKGMLWVSMGSLGLLLSLASKAQFVTGDPIPALNPFMQSLTSFSTQFYAAFLNLPGAAAIRFPVRFQVIFLLSLAVGAAYGAHAILDLLEWTAQKLRTQYEARRGQPLTDALMARMHQVSQGILFACCIVLALVINSRMLQVSRFHEIFALTPLHEPAWVKLVNADPTPGAIMHLPTDLQGRYQLYYQTLHERPLLGFVDFVTSRRYELQQKMLPMSYCNALYAMQLRGYDDFLQGYPSHVPEWPEKRFTDEQLGRLKLDGLRYVLVERKRFQPESLAEFEAYTQTWLEKVPVPADSAIASEGGKVAEVALSNAGGSPEFDVYRLR